MERYVPEQCETGKLGNTIDKPPTKVYLVGGAVRRPPYLDLPVVGPHWVRQQAATPEYLEQKGYQKQRWQTVPRLPTPRKQRRNTPLLAKEKKSIGEGYTGLLFGTCFPTFA